MIAETAGGGATGSTGTVREYLSLYEAEIAPTRASRTEVDRPLAVIDAVNTVSPVMRYVHELLALWRSGVTNEQGLCALSVGQLQQLIGQRAEALRAHLDLRPTDVGSAA